MLRKIRELIATILMKITAWIMPLAIVKRQKDDLELPASVRKLFDMAALPVPDRQIEALKPYPPVVKPETEEEKAALQSAIVSAKENDLSNPFELRVVDPFEEDISNAIIDALKASLPKKEEENEE